MSNYQYIQSVSPNGVGIININRPIGNYLDDSGKTVQGVSGPDFVSEMKILQGTCKEINVVINSEGGSPIDSYVIVNGIQGSKIPVRTTVSGIASGSAVWIAASGHKGLRDIVDYGSEIVRKSTDDNAEVSEVIDKSISRMLVNSMNKTPEEIAKIFATESNFSPIQAVKTGLADNVVSTGKKELEPSSVENLTMGIYKGWTYSDFERKKPDYLRELYLKDRNQYDQLFSSDPKYKKKFF